MLSKKIAVKNSFVSLVAQLVSMLLGFVTRRIFLQYLGLEIQGVNSVVSETLSFLSLAELGIGSAITYRLYKPLVENDEETIASLMQLYKYAYRIIAAVISVAGLVMMAFLPFIITDQTMDFSFIQLVYIIQLITSVSSYFYAYKRSLMYADQKQFICKIVDLSLNIVFSILRIWVMVVYRNYILYLILQLLQSILSNIVVAKGCDRLFPYLVKKKAKHYDKVKEIFVDTKDILMGKIAGYIWSSTDSIVVSAFNGIVSAGGLSNYKFVVNAAKNMLYSITEPIAATIGNFLQVKDKEESFRMLKAYVFFRFVMIDIAATGLVICTNTFVGLFFGEQYVLNEIISVLMVTDIFIGVIYGPMAEMINLLGYFAEDKIINFTGAFVNITISIILAQTMGMEGVLIGTCISQLVFWIGKSILVFKKYFKEWRKFAEIWKQYISYVIVEAGQTIGILYIVEIFFEGDYSLGAFIAEVVICVVVSAGVIVLIFGRSEEFKYLYNIVLSALEKNRGNE